MKNYLAIILLLPILAFAQSGSIGGGTYQQPAPAVQPSLETSTWRGTGTGMSVVSRLDACKQARKDGDNNIVAMAFRLQNGFRRVVKGDSMSECMCEGPAAGGWYTCNVDISVTHTNR